MDDSEACASGHRVASADAAYLIADILTDNDARTPAFGPESPLRFEFPVACKTGTSSDFRDNWAFGFTPEFTVGVWVGNFDGTPMRNVSGVSGAAPILHDVFEQLHQQFGTTWYPRPANVEEHWIHPLTGHRLEAAIAVDGTPGIRERFMCSNPPPLENAGDYLVDATSDARIRLSAEYREWVASGDNGLGDRFAVESQPQTVRVAFPPPGTTFYIDPDLPDHGRRIHLRAEGPDDLQWTSDSLQLEGPLDRRTAFLAPGRHQIRVKDPRTGNGDETWIEVLLR